MNEARASSGHSSGQARHDQRITASMPNSRARGFGPCRHPGAERKRNPKSDIASRDGKQYLRDAVEWIGLARASNYGLKQLLLGVPQGIG